MGRNDDGPRLEAEGQTPTEDQSPVPDGPMPAVEGMVTGKVRPIPREPDTTHYRDRRSA